MPVPTMEQEPSCRSRLSVTPAGPVPLPRSGVIVFCRMKFTIRILSKEKLWLKAALGIQTCVVWPWKTGEGREKVCTKIQGRKVGRNGELAVDNEKPASLHMVGGGGLLWKMNSLAQL